MKWHSRLLTLVATGLALHAQVDVDLVLSRESFLPGEPIEVTTRFANFTGRPLTLGTEPGWLQFTVERGEGRVVTKQSDPPESGEFTLKQSTRGKLKWNLTPLFNLEDTGAYRVFASIRLPDGELRTTTSVPFEIIAGVPLHEPRELGVKLPDGSIERRKFVLQQVNFLKKLQLYLRITDPTESRTLSITPLGTTVSFDRPQWAVDGDTHFHVLHRASGKTYLYHVFQGDGTLLTRQLWEGETRPQLEILNESGEIGVKGGQRRVSSSDFPPPPETTNSVSLKEPAPSGTASSTSESNKNDTPPPPQ